MVVCSYCKFLIFYLFFKMQHLFCHRTSGSPQFACKECGARIQRGEDKENVKRTQTQPLSIDLPTRPNVVNTQPTVISQTFRDFDTRLRTCGPAGANDFEAQLRSIRQPLDTSSWMFQPEPEEAKYNPAAQMRINQLLASGQGSKTPYNGKLKVNCIYCSTDIQTTYEAHRSLLDRMQVLGHFIGFLSQSTILIANQ